MTALAIVLALVILALVSRRKMTEELSNMSLEELDNFVVDVTLLQPIDGVEIVRESESDLNADHGEGKD